ncbi:MAG: hypothetical protein IT435_08855 [Phycisphaerales bacterium]|nr:hypothetical protein [Phycisphaerales bacterium]
MRHSCLCVSLALASPTLALAQACPPWEVVPSPNAPSAVQSVIRDIAAIGQSDVWAVGSYFNNERIAQMAMHWDGSAWTFFDIPVPIPTGSGYLWAVEAAGPDVVWAAGDALGTGPDSYVGTHMLVVRWDGTGWTRLDTPIGTGGSGDSIYDIEFVSADEVWFVGEGFPIPATAQPPLAMRWKNGSFELMDPPSINPKVSGFGNGNSFHALDALSPTDIWMVGSAGDGDSISGHSQIFHWNGSQWQHRPGPIPGVFHDLNAVAALSSNDVWAGGDYFDGVSYRGLSMHWDGTSWTQFPVQGTINDFVAFGPNDVFAVGAFVMHWNGSAWSIVESFPTVDAPALTGISAIGPCQMWTAGRQIDGESVFNFAARIAPSCPADFDGSGFVDTDDFDAFVLAFIAGGDDADFDRSGFVDTEDYDAFVHAFEAGC